MAITRLTNLNWLELPDCVCLSNNGYCSLLKVSACEGDTCSFKITQKEKEDSERKVRERLSSLDEETQDKISRMYYNGTRPWHNNIKEKPQNMR